MRKNSIYNPEFNKNVVEECLSEVKTRKNGIYSPEFKKNVIKECLTGISIEVVHRKYNVPQSTIRGWVENFNNKMARKNSHLSSFDAVEKLRELEIYTAKRIKELTDLNETLKEENEALKKSVSIFAAYYKQAV